ncbi:putative DCC family thiol-disulfide oxidoreductase YuxK [Panacagrimonas perspica]|uniref:Putative DCC family thiol-disulfide oxidoreductase YuxK n=1 Tax=Panacagrimonas perspica TaxID=381431 RepID=A0A4S3K0L8_9GAMM|nr:DCC1-like thiol-disulfide oxidoreductase family protein [Panacagrimonas perspica]TDU24394.1 putative DCC family thiol-disulfide oxidoreductase YuxK [Panacagrimonas perspica]THD01465.1 hypothetical protein B1810_20240 [Panacagrimonas perspica]
MAVHAQRHSYRDDASVPRFDDGRPIVVFDGVCVLCSGSMHFIQQHDTRDAFRFVLAQSALGQALFRHYGLPAENFDTVLVLDDGVLHTKLDAFAAVMRRLPGAWRVLSAARFIPSLIADLMYDLVAKNRYRWFGKREACLMPTAALRARFLPDGWKTAPAS